MGIMHAQRLCIWAAAARAAVQHAVSGVRVGVRVRLWCVVSLGEVVRTAGYMIGCRSYDHIWV